ncbi:hypothetical protein DYB30_004618 [Aphanomyces astaci]|uniref:Elicitin-like protein n=1 Tax=Aphanomyces astaci TaxID=112090 RepID=A0A397EE22_APHAT|nr:hypothetical protein DYB30_004618 [Aphanomyces astaci]RHY81562.1 hypothetical protein DYB31_011305 [Aphanomyces astaci]
MRVRAAVLLLATLTRYVHAEMVESKPLNPCNETEQVLIEKALGDGLVAPAECQALWGDFTANFSSPVDKWDQISMNDALFAQVCSIPACKDALKPWTLLPDCDAMIDVTSKEIANLFDMAIHTSSLCESVLNNGTDGSPIEDKDEGSNPDFAPSDSSAPPKQTFIRTAPPPSTTTALATSTKRPMTPRPTMGSPMPTAASSSISKLISSVVLLSVASLVCI